MKFRIKKGLNYTLVHEGGIRAGYHPGHMYTEKVIDMTPIKTGKGLWYTSDKMGGLIYHISWLIPLNWGDDSFL